MRLQRLLPGTTASLFVTRDKNHNLITDPAEMTAILNEHWGSMFSHKEVATHKIASWLVDVPSFPASSDARWKLNREHVATEVKVARESAPGPDGTPYRAWKAVGSLGVDCLFQAAVFLQRPDSTHFFCHPILMKPYVCSCVCLGLSISEHDQLCNRCDNDNDKGPTATA